MLWIAWAVALAVARAETKSSGGAAINRSTDAATAHAETIARILWQDTAAKPVGDVEGGTLHERAVNTVAEVGVDVIAVTKRGVRRHVSMNSPLARALRTARRPVLVVPSAAAERPRTTSREARAA